MVRKLFVALVSLLLSSAVMAQDAAKTNPGKYTVVMENERVRVLDYRDHPGDKTTQHSHPDFVLYALSDFQRRLTFPDGKSVTREFKTGDVVFMKAQTHVGENIGKTDTHVIIVELKEPQPSLTAPTPPKR